MTDWILDLCSGLGGASEAFVKDPHWTVVRIENNPKLEDVPHTWLLDILNWIDWLPEVISELGRPTAIWASPPCLEFSTARTWEQGRTNDPDMSIVEAVFDIVEYAKPRFWIVENVAGACPHFLPYFGHFQQKIGPFFLWGAYPYISVPEGFTHSKAAQDVWSSDPLRANKKAYIPRSISEGFLDAICSQTKLSDWV